MIKTTIIGGVLFLLPIALVVLLLGKAYEISLLVAAPIDRIIPIEDFAGVAVANIIAILVLLAVCYAAGLVARREAISGKMEALDNAFAQTVPAYGFVKGMITSFARVESETENMKPVLVALDDMTQLAFEVERDEEKVVVYFPGSPSPWSGSIGIVEPSRVTPFNVRTHEAAKLAQVIGRGTLGAMERAKTAGA